MPTSLDQKMELSLRLELERVHLNFIQLEDCPAKIRLRSELQELCEKWLSCMAHYNKFMLTELPVILRNSILAPNYVHQEVALDEVADAFLALAKYTANIVAQPWRQEFRTIKRYGGYFLQEVGLVLQDIDKLMAYIGFQKADNNTFTLNIELTATELVRSLPSIALDYMLVATECQLMSRILAAVNISDVSVNLLKVLQYREFHVSSWEVAVRGLMYEARLNNFARTQQSSMEPQALPFALDRAPFCISPSPYPHHILDHKPVTQHTQSDLMNQVIIPLDHPLITHSLSNKQAEFHPYPHLRPMQLHMQVRQAEVPEQQCSHVISPGQYDTTEGPDMYLNSSFPQTLVEPLMPQQVKHQLPASNKNRGYTTVPRSKEVYKSDDECVEAKMGKEKLVKRAKNPSEEILYSDEECSDIQRDSETDFASGLPHRYCTTPRQKNVRAETESVTRGRDSWSKLGEAQLLAHTNQEPRWHATPLDDQCSSSQQKISYRDNVQNGFQPANVVPAIATNTNEPKNKSEKKSQATKAADSRAESWEYVFKKLEIQAPTPNEENDICQDREKVAKTVAELQMNATPQLLQTAKEIYNRPNELDNLRYQEFIKNTPKIDGVVQHPIANLPWPERFKYLYYRGEREALVGYTELLASVNEAAKPAPPKASEDNNWSCQSCTWVNSQAKTICCMCNKSRNLGTAAEPPKPGPQCIQCTLVNPTGRDYCEACGASLDLLYI